MKSLACLTVLTLALAQPSAKGDIAPPGSIVARFVGAECVVVGKVTEIEDKTVKIPYPGQKDPVEFKVGVVKVEHLGKGGEKGLTHVKVCFLPAGVENKRGRPQTHLKANQEVLLFLQKHPAEPYYFCPGFYGQVSKENPEFDNNVAQVKLCTKFLADPDAGLKSKDAKERLLASALLLSEYRRAPNPKAKTEAIPADQSQAILLTLAATDWTKQDPVLGWDLMPQTLFAKLGLGKDDGWTTPGPDKDFSAEAKKWLKANAETYRIKKFVK